MKKNNIAEKVKVKTLKQVLSNKNLNLDSGNKKYLNKSFLFFSVIISIFLFLFLQYRENFLKNQLKKLEENPFKIINAVKLDIFNEKGKKVPNIYYATKVVAKDLKFKFYDIKFEFLGDATIYIYDLRDNMLNVGMEKGQILVTDEKDGKVLQIETLQAKVLTDKFKTTKVVVETAYDYTRLKVVIGSALIVNKKTKKKYKLVKNQEIFIYSNGNRKGPYYVR